MCLCGGFLRLCLSRFVVGLSVRLDVKCSCHACWLVICVAFEVGTFVGRLVFVLVWSCGGVLSCRIVGLCLFLDFSGLYVWVD